MFYSAIKNGNKYIISGGKKNEFTYEMRSVETTLLFHSMDC